MKEKKVKAISDLFAAIAKLGLNFSENQIEKKIANDLVQRGALLFLQPTRDIVLALNDSDPNNAEQVKELILDWVNADLSEYLEDLADAGIAKVKDEKGKALLNFAVDVITDVLRLITDDEEENDRQIKLYFEKLIASEAFQVIVVQVLLGAILDKANAKPLHREAVKAAAKIVLDFISAKPTSQNILTGGDEN